MNSYTVVGAFINGEPNVVRIIEGQHEITSGDSGEFPAWGMTVRADSADSAEQAVIAAMRAPHELTHRELEAMPDGTPLHFTNWPGKPSMPVTRVHHEDGNVRFADGRHLFAMPDELTYVPRAGLEYQERETGR